VCITTNKPNTECNPNPNPTTKQHAVVSIQLNISYPTHPDKFIGDNIVAPFVLLSFVIVTLPGTSFRCHYTRVTHPID